MPTIHKCRAGYKLCGKRCFPRNVKCADEKDKNSRYSSQSLFNPMNLAILGVGAAVFAGMTFAVVKYARAKSNTQHKTYTKPMMPSDAAIDQVIPTPPVISPRERTAYNPDWGTTDERSLTPNQRRLKAVHWAQSKLHNAENVFVIDFETNGLIEGVNPMTDSYDKVASIKPPGVVQISLHRLDGAETYNVVLNPEEVISPAASRVHGLKQEDVEGQPTFKDIYPFLKKTLEGKELIAFNARFDTQLLDALCEANGLERINLSNRNENGFVDNDGDAMHYFGLFNGRQPRKRDNLARAQLPRRVDMEQQVRELNYDLDYDPYADLPKVDGVRFGEAHDSLEDVFSLTELIYRMASNQPVRDRLSRPWQMKN